jgi:zinc transport system ATP-binding protein
MDAEPLLAIEGLSVMQGEREVVRDLSFEIRAGEFVSIIGPNGAGKSTLLKAIVGLLPAARGRIVSRARQIGYVPQQAVPERAAPITVAEFLSLRMTRGRFWLGVPRSLREEIRARLDEVGAGALYSRPLSELSGGEYQRVLIAYALVKSPDLLLMDEPLTGIDMRGSLSFDGLLHHLHEHRRIAVVMVSHDLHLVEHLSDHVYCINRDLCCHGTADDVLKPENLARAYGHLPGMVPARGGSAFIRVKDIH